MHRGVLTTRILLTSQDSNLTFKLLYPPKTSTHIDSSKESVSVTEILPFTPLISLVCNLQIYTCFTSYDEKKRTLRQCFTSDLPFYPISCSFLRLFSPQHPLPYPTMEKIIQSKRYLGCHFNYLIG